MFEVLQYVGWTLAVRWRMVYGDISNIKYFISSYCQHARAVLSCLTALLAPPSFPAFTCATSLVVTLYSSFPITLPIAPPRSHDFTLIFFYILPHSSSVFLPRPYHFSAVLMSFSSPLSYVSFLPTSSFIPPHLIILWFQTRLSDRASIVSIAPLGFPSTKPDM